MNTRHIYEAIEEALQSNMPVREERQIDLIPRLAKRVKHAYENRQCVDDEVKHELLRLATFCVQALQSHEAVDLKSAMKDYEVALKNVTKALVAEFVADAKPTSKQLQELAEDFEKSAEVVLEIKDPNWSAVLSKKDKKLVVAALRAKVETAEEPSCLKCGWALGEREGDPLCSKCGPK